MSPQPNHYEALGLPPTATAEQIKKRYRELARRYHPDVNSSADAANKILSVNQAYQVLGDADRRAAYDSERALQQAAAQARRPEPPAPASPRSHRTAAHPSSPRAPMHFDGFGRAFTEPEPDRRPAPHRSAARAKASPDTRSMSVEQALAEAKLAFINREFRRAQLLCQDVLRTSPREAVAHEILGDIYARQGDSQRASTAFSYAIQFNPRNQSAQAKLERLMRATAAPRGRPSITYTRHAAHSTMTSAPSDAGIAIVTLAAGGLLLAAPISLSFSPGSPSSDGLFGLTFNLLLALAVGGASAGVLLALYARMRPFAEEIWSRAREDGTRAPAPLGVILALFAFVWFYASLLIYIGIAAMRNRFSPSILRVYAATLCMVFVFSLAYHPVGIANFSWAVTLLGGNLLFPMVLLGWLVGDTIRLRGRV